MENRTAISKIETISKKVLSEFYLEGTVSNILKFFENDKNYSYSEMIKTPQEISNQLSNMGLTVETFNLKSDGKTSYLDCIMPQLWDINDASLEIISPESEIQLISDHSMCRFITPNRCKETPKEGTIGELILESDLDGIDARGKFVLSFRSPGRAKADIIERGAAAIVSGFSESFGKIGDGVFWANGWSQSSGWYHTIDEPRITTFMISCNKAKDLEKLIKSGKRIILKGIVDSRTFDGNLKAISTVIPGNSKKEILLISHMYEPFPSDNGDGNAAMLEIARSITKSIKENKIPKPEQTIRFLFTYEKYGASSFFEDKERTKNIVAAVNLDCLSLSPEFTGLPAENRFATCANPSIFDVVMLEKIDMYLGNDDVKNIRGSFSDDTFAGDPTIGIPFFWLMPNIGNNHHNSSLKFEISDWTYYSKMYNAITDFILELAYFNEDFLNEKYDVYLKILDSINKTEYSNLGKRAKEMSLKELKSNINFIQGWNINRIKFLKEMGISSILIDKMIKEQSRKDLEMEKSLLSNTSCMKKEITRPLLDSLTKTIPHRLIIGMPFSLSKIPFKERIKNPTESESLQSDTDILFAWMDGKRNFKECIELYEMDIQQKLSDEELKITIEYVEYLTKWGYFRLESSN